MLLGTSEAAQRIKISERRLRVLLEEGRVRGQLVSGRWVIEESDLAHFHSSRMSGRPLSPRSAWQLAHRASGELLQREKDLAPTAIERHRLNLRLQRLRDSSDPLTLVSSLLAGRAERVELSSSQGDIAELRQDSRIRLSGVSHPAAGLLSNSEVEAYVDRKDYKPLISEWLLVGVAPGHRPNVVLHVAEDIPEELPLMLVAADLAERPGVRERAAALEIINRLKCINS